jgi:DNA-binding transcriptional ArsR family regulator
MATVMPRERGVDEPSAVREDGLEALNAIANEHRIRILRALATADEPLSFSELRRAVGLEDPGRFNYHLSELRGRFVTETETGYDLGDAGQRVVVAAADLDPEAAAMSVGGAGPAPDEECPVCGAPDCDRLVHVHLTPG